MNKQKNDYFKLANDWQFDRVQMAKIHGNRWFIAFLVSSCIVILLTITIVVLMPLKTLIPIVIHQNTKTGEVWVDRPSNPYVPETQAETEADITRYITNRESYSSSDINQRFHLVMLLSDGNIGSEYANIQANSNKESPVNVLGLNGTRQVNIEDIIFIDKNNIQELRHFHQPSTNLAKVDFTTETKDTSGLSKTDYWVATIGWIYKGLPDTQANAWDNWNGFTVTTYRVDQRLVSNSDQPTA